MRATLTKVLTKDAFARMISAAERWTAGVEKRSPTSTCPGTSRGWDAAANISFAHSARNGAQAHDAMDFELERFMHLYAMNRGILLTPSTIWR